MFITENKQHQDKKTSNCHEIVSPEPSSVSNDEEYISPELQQLRIRAKKLSEDLKSLSLETESMKAASEVTGVGPDGQPIDQQSEQIKEIMKRYSDIIGSIYIRLLI